MQELLRKNQHDHWNEKHQNAFDSVKQALADATALAAPNDEGRFVLDTDASAVAIAGILHQEQEHNGKTILRPIVYGSKSLTRTQMNCGAPKLEMYAVFCFIEKFHSYLAGPLQCIGKLFAAFRGIRDTKIGKSREIQDKISF